MGITLTDIANNNIHHWIYQHNSYEKFAEFVGIGRRTVTRILEDDISDKTFKKICQAYQKTEDEVSNICFFSLDSMDMFCDTYYMYSLADDSNDEIYINKTVLQIKKDKTVEATTVLKAIKPKRRTGKIHIDNNYICMDLFDNKNHLYVMLLKPNVELPRKYLGGLGVCLEPFNANKEISVHSVILSNLEFQRDEGTMDRDFLCKELVLNDKINFYKQSLDREARVFEYIKNRVVRSKKS